MQVVLPKPGTYVVAVSGGVDSMSLLHLLQRHNTAKPKPYVLIVAHLDHGIREDAVEDRRLVQQVAREYGLPFVYHQVQLGLGASESAARKARYEFLERVRESSNATAIITAHHQDDVLETAIHNLVRGTGRKGVAALGARQGFMRPLLEVPKHIVVQHATARSLKWREDSTNTDTAYTRNYIRHKILTRFKAADRQQFVDIIQQMRQTNQKLDAELSQQLAEHCPDGQLDKKWFILLPHAVAREVLAAWLRQHQVRGFDKPKIERLTVAAKVSLPGSQFNVINGAILHVGTERLALKPSER